VEKLLKAIERLIETLEEFRPEGAPHKDQKLRMPKGVRARRVLERAGIETYGDLRKVSRRDLLARKGCGFTTMMVIVKYAEFMGITIPEKNP